ncbi:MAG: mhqE [Phycisphaerales bacterium]|nr:mhqE [Phycisphaerales bacterium]
MNTDITGIHHVTALSGPAGQNLAFYTNVLGFRLVKKTVNFDDPHSYHFYFGDRGGRPGTLITFFPHPGFRPGVAGAGEVAATHLAVGPGAIGYWADRLKAAGVDAARQSAGGQERLRFTDPDGTRLSLVEAAGGPAEGHAPASDVPADQAILGIASVTVVVNRLAPTAAFLTDTLGFRQVAAEGNRAWFEPTGGGDGGGPDDAGTAFVAGVPPLEVIEVPAAPRPVLGVGSVHHVAWRVADDAARDRVRAAVDGKVLGLTPVKDRSYFRSIYFREPGHTIFEVATAGPGFAADEDPATLGTALKLPPQFESRRAEIEAALPPLEANPS